MGANFPCKSPGVHGGGMVMAKIDSCIRRVKGPEVLQILKSVKLLHGLSILTTSNTEPIYTK